MAGFEYRSGGRRVSQAQFFENISKKIVDIAMDTLSQRAQGAAASIVDPATGRHAAVFVRRVDNNLVVRTEGSPAFARELERRLGVEKGSIESVEPKSKPAVPYVYLAHASQDHETLARPLAERLMAGGIEVWLDAWEINTGDSLKRKMEEGLEACTHFVVLLTSNSIGKPWVETEIDAGFMRAVQDKARFMGLRIGVEVAQLSVFLQTTRCPEVDLADPAQVKALIADLHGVTAKPPRGPAPTYVKRAPAIPSGWSAAAARVAEHLVVNSSKGVPMDPMARIPQVAEATGLSEEDVRLGVLDLQDAGLVERSKEIGGQTFWPRRGLFVEFDEPFLGLKTKDDALAVANRLVSEGALTISLNEEFAQRFPDWTVRRINSALAYLEDANLVEALHALGQGQWAMSRVTVTDRTRRFIRDHG